MMYYIGIDVSKKDLAVFDGKKDLIFINQEGLTSFKKYLKKKYNLQEIAIIFEPTGVYSLYLKEFLRSNLFYHQIPIGLSLRHQFRYNI